MRHLLCSLFAVMAFCAGAVSPADEISSNPCKSASNYYAYPDSALPELTPAPVGYYPFHIEHYGRHGSRWLLSPEQYSAPIEELQKAERNGRLTMRGKEVLSQLKEIRTASENRTGELTDLGAEQHRRIARRMMKNFPEVFSGDAVVDAKSTNVIRCILSMANEAIEFRAINPEIDIRMDASGDEMYYMNGTLFDPEASHCIKQADSLLNEFRAKHLIYEHFLRTLVTDVPFASDSMNVVRLFDSLFDVAANVQSHKNQQPMYDLFTQEELYNRWLRDNAKWYIESGNTPMTQHRPPYNQRQLLRNIIESADTAIVSSCHGANLRFGHESVVLPLAVLMELNFAGVSIDNLDDLAAVWQNYAIFPMACNIQLIFYRSLSSPEIVVKVLLNETEADLPIDSDIKPYYKWTDVRNYYMKKLHDFALRSVE